MASIKHTPGHIWALINENNIDGALKILTSMQDGSAWAQNAIAVCWMRLGNPQKAVDILMNKVYMTNSVILRSDASDSTRLNLVTALFMTGNVDGALTILNKIEHDTPMKEMLKKAYQEWKKQQPIWSRMAMFMGIYPDNKPVKMDFPVGQMEVSAKEAFMQ